MRTGRAMPYPDGPREITTPHARPPAGTSSHRSGYGSFVPCIILGRGAANMPPPESRRSRFTSRAGALGLLTSMLFAGCAGSEAPDFRGRRARNVTIPIDVRNQHYSDIVVRVSRGGAWQRIGDVTGNSSERLEIPAALTAPTGDYRFRVHAIGTPDDA